MNGKAYWPYRSEGIVSEASEVIDKMLDSVGLTEKQERAINRAIKAIEALYDLSEYDAQDRSRYFPTEGE
jgi:hypothetical protein